LGGQAPQHRVAQGDQAAGKSGKSRPLFLGFDCVEIGEKSTEGGKMEPPVCSKETKLSPAQKRDNLTLKRQLLDHPNKYERGRGFEKED